jgi:hypothetical protein
MHSLGFFLPALAAQEQRPSGSGAFIGYYYAGFNTLAFTRTDPEINFNWGTGQPHPSFYRENYTFNVMADDGRSRWSL